MKIFVLKVMILCVLLQLLCLMVDGAWKPAGGPPGRANVLTAIDGVLLVGGDCGGVYRSIDNGESWEYCGITDNCIMSFGVSDNMVFAGTNSTLYTSADKGETWAWLRTTPINDYIEAILCISGTVFIGGAFDGVFRSDDYGETWDTINTGLTNTSIVAFAFEDDVLYVGTKGGVFKSSNRGDTWTATALTFKTTALIAYDGILVAGLYGSTAKRSTDGGDTWTDARSGISYNSLDVFALKGEYLFAGSGTVYRTQKDEAEWTEMFFGKNHNIFSLTVNNKNLFAGTNAGIIVSSDDGESWKQSDKGFANTDVNVLLAINDGILAGTSSQGIWKTTDNGGSWIHLDSNMSPSTSIYFMDEVEGVQYAKTGHNGMNYSTDGGLTWTRFDTSSENGMYYSVAKVGKTIVVGGNSKVLRSTDGGESWKHQTVEAADSSRIISFLVVDSVIFAGTHHSGVLRSSDEGETWIKMNSGLDALLIHCFAKLGQTIFIGTENGISYSKDRGELWTAIKSDVFDDDITNLQVYRGYLFASGYSTTCMLSSDTGETWIPVDSGFTEDADLNCLAIRNDTLFAGLDGYGVWYRPLREVVKITRDSHRKSLYSAPIVIDGIVRYGDIVSVNVILSSTACIGMSVYSLSGKRVWMADGAEVVAGYHTFNWYAGGVPAGCYMVEVNTSNHRGQKKMVLFR